eukprot:2299486-Pleurochrysis_carterae.AAC.1
MNKTPCEMKMGIQPHIDKFRTLFCSATCCLCGEAQELSQLAPRFTESIYLGIDQRRGGYSIYLFEITPHHRVSQRRYV